MRYAKHNDLWDRTPDWDSGDLRCYHSSAITSLPSCALDFPSSHLFVSVTQSNVPSPPVHTLPEKCGDVPPLAVPDFFLHPPNPTHGVIVAPSSAPVWGRLPSFLLVPSAGDCVPGPDRSDPGLTDLIRPAPLSRATQVQS